MNRQDFEDYEEELCIGHGMFSASDFLPIGMEFCKRCDEAVEEDTMDRLGYCEWCADDMAEIAQECGDDDDENW